MYIEIIGQFKRFTVILRGIIIQSPKDRRIGKILRATRMTRNLPTLRDFAVLDLLHARKVSLSTLRVYPLNFLAIRTRFTPSVRKSANVQDDVLLEPTSILV